MKKQWSPSKQLFLGLPCIEHVVTKELALVGRYGEVWISGKAKCAATIYSHRIARRYLQKDQWPIDPHDETMIVFQAQDLAAWVKRLVMPKKPESQAEIANAGRETAPTRSNLRASNGNFFSSEAKNQSQHEGEPIPIDSPMDTNFSLQTQNLNLHRDGQ